MLRRYCATSQRTSRLVMLRCFPSRGRVGTAWQTRANGSGPKHHKPLSAEELISQVPPRETEESVVKCDGGDGALGHPVEYIQLDTRQEGKIETCKYCGLRFVKKRKH